MPFAVFMEWPGATKENYELLRKEVNWEGDRPKGGNLHLAAVTDDGLRVTDIWDTEADFNTFVGTRLMPAVERLGIPGQPQVAVYPLHALYAPNVQPQ